MQENYCFLVGFSNYICKWLLFIKNIISLQNTSLPLDCLFSPATAVIGTALNFTETSANAPPALVTLMMGPTWFSATRTTGAESWRVPNASSLAVMIRWAIVSTFGPRRGEFGTERQEKLIYQNSINWPKVIRKSQQDSISQMGSSFGVSLYYFYQKTRTEYYYGPALI